MRPKRLTRSTVLLGIIVVGALTGALGAQSTAPAPLHIEKLKDNLYVITGGRGTGSTSSTVSGNTTVFVSASGVVLVDTKLPGFGAGILAEVKSVTSKPITMIINTHTHADHTGGNPELPRNVEHVAQQNTRANMARMDLFKGANEGLLPSTTFRDRMSLMQGADRIDLYYFGPGHTNGDAIVVFPTLRVAAVGDLFARKWAPLVDAANGGSVSQFPSTLDKAIAGIKDVDQVITGHATTPIGREGTFSSFSPISRWSDLQEYAAFTHAFVDAVRAAKTAGKSVDEALAGIKLPERFRNYNMTNARADIQRLYEEEK